MLHESKHTSETMFNVEHKYLKYRRVLRNIIKNGFSLLEISKTCM